VIPVEDFVEAYNDGYSWYDWGGYGSHAAAGAGRPSRPQNRSRPSAPRASPGSPGGSQQGPRRLREFWLEPKRSINDFQLLWSDEALGSLPVLTSGSTGDCGLFFGGASVTRYGPGLSTVFMLEQVFCYLLSTMVLPVN
jgi:hypothetical protein